MDICIYLRKSRADENMSIREVLRRHRLTLLSYAEKNNHKIIDIKEEIVSGESILCRPKMLELMGEIEANHYEGVLVMDMDRLGRGNMREQGLILETFKESNTLIMTPNKIYDLSNEFDEDFSEFEAFMARRELKIIKKRLQRGREKSLEEGNYLSPYPPFGYIKRDKSLIIDPDNCNTIKLIYDLYVNKGYGDSRIANHLSSLGLNNASHNTLWDKTSIRKILSNPVYIGKIVWRKRTHTIDKHGKRRSTTLEKSAWSIYQGKHTPLIDEQTFNKAQLISTSRRTHKTHNSKQLKNPLAKLLKCSNCGATMTLRTSRDKLPSIRCYKNCGVKSSYLHVIEERIIKKAFMLLKEMDYNFSFINNNVTLEQRTILVAKDASTKEKLKYDGQLSRIYDLLEEGIYSKSVFEERRKFITTKIVEIDNNIGSLNKRLRALSNAESTISSIDKIKTLQGSIGFFKSLTPEEKNDILSILFNEIKYYKAKDWDKDRFDLTYFTNL